MSQPLPPIPNADFVHRLDIAPPARSPNRYILVIVCGLASTALALYLFCYRANQVDTNLMGIYIWNFVPVGAALVGAAASVGYTLAAWFAGVKIRRGLLLTIILLQVAAYFAAKYTEFAVQGPLVDAAGHPVGFLNYFHATTVNMAWKDDQGKLGAPLGLVGYALRLAEVVGFTLGALVSPIILARKPYCDLCERYRTTKSLAVLPASNIKAGHLFGKKASPLTSQEALEAGMTDVVELVSLANNNDAAGFAARIQTLAPQRKAAAKLSRQIQVRLVSCPRCASGWLEVEQTETRGREVTKTDLGRTELTQEFVRALRQNKTI